MARARAPRRRSGAADKSQVLGEVDQLRCCVVSIAQKSCITEFVPRLCCVGSVTRVRSVLRRSRRAASPPRRAVPASVKRGCKRARISNARRRDWSRRCLEPKLRRDARLPSVHPVTTLSESFTLLTPSVAFATATARCRPASDRTVPLSVTAPLVTSTSMSLSSSAVSVRNCA